MVGFPMTHEEMTKIKLSEIEKRKIGFKDPVIRLREEERDALCKAVRLAQKNMVHLNQLMLLEKPREWVELEESLSAFDWSDE